MVTLPAFFFKQLREISIYKDAFAGYNIRTVINEARGIGMNRSFPETLSALRRERSISQRAAAADLGISQALLSHYENGAREPGLGFVCRACDYYGVSADFLLGRTDRPNAALSAATTAAAFLDRMQELIGSAHRALDEFTDREDET
jgi:transcriptional regulator with XRE-family HTH domain